MKVYLVRHHNEFGLGLIISGMASPARVLAFLDLAVNWDTPLILVMGAVGLWVQWGGRVRNSALAVDCKDSLRGFAAPRTALRRRGLTPAGSDPSHWGAGFGLNQYELPFATGG